MAIFFDGPNFYAGLQSLPGNPDIEYGKMTRWLMKRFNAEFAGAYYYTGFESGADPKFASFLKHLEHVEGYFVRREPLVHRERACPHCKKRIEYTEEKRVDTRLVAEMMQLAAVDSYDIAVLCSGDQDMLPATEAVASLGKKVYVATWSGRGLSDALRAVCFGEIDLTPGLPEFKR